MILQYNETIKDFLIKKNINYSIENNSEATCYNKKEINSIIARFGMYKNKQSERICIFDIIGKDRGKSQNLFSELNDLFDRDGESYRKRSISMLQYNSKEVIEKLGKSFKDEPIELKEIKHGKYIIGNNGMHRVNLLKVHYLNELESCKNKKEIAILNEKYTIEVAVEKLDVIKTYSKYLLSLINNNWLIEDEINDKYNKTENVVIYDGREMFKILDNTQLIKFVEDRINVIKNNKELINLYEKDEYFREYLKFFSINKMFNK